VLVRLSEVCDKLPSAIYITGVTGRDREPLVSGGFADIFRANYNGKVVALKRLRPLQNARRREANQRVRTSGSDSELKGRRSAQKLGSEALLWKHLRHPYVLPFLGIDSESFPHEYCMVSPWMKHGTILSHIQRVGPERVDLDRHVSIALSTVQNQT
jgi:Protein tyrosine and serine/threonine kinase